MEMRAIQLRMSAVSRVFARFIIQLYILFYVSNLVFSNRHGRSHEVSFSVVLYVYNMDNCTHHTRSVTRHDLIVPATHLMVTRSTFSYMGPFIRNQLPEQTGDAPSLSTFKSSY